MATLRIDETEYEIDDLSESVKVKVARMQEIQTQISNLNMQANELQTVLQAYVNTIKEELQPAGELVEQDEMEALDAIGTIWPIAFGFVTLVIVLAKMHSDIEQIKEKIRTLFDLFNNRFK